MEMSMKTLALKQENLKRDEYFRRYLEMIEHESEREEKLKEMEDENKSLQSTLNNMRRCQVFTTQVQVEESMIGLVIGRKGQTVTKIMQATGTNIETRPKGIFLVTGTEEQCQHAKKRIEAIIDEKRQSMVFTTKSQLKSSEPVQDRLLSIITGLSGTDSVKFSRYEGTIPTVWKSRQNRMIYYLEPAGKHDMSSGLETSVEEMRNYFKLEEVVIKRMRKILDEGRKVSVNLEIRFGKVLWLGESEHGPPKSIHHQLYQVKGLEQNGLVLMKGDSVLARTKWSFYTKIPDLERMSSLNMDQIGEIEMININFLKSDGGKEQINVSIECKRKSPDKTPQYELLRVGSRWKKDMTYDCLYLEGPMDIRMVLSHCEKSDDRGGVNWDWARKLVETLTVDKEKHIISFHGYPGNYKPNFIRYIHRKLYLIEHDGSQYISAHFALKDCCCASANGPHNLDSSHEELELWNVQWMADFAQLEGIDWREVFSSAGCDVSKLPCRVKPRKIEIQQFIKELRSYIQLALQVVWLLAA